MKRANGYLFYSGTPLRPKATGVEPHTHTKGRAGIFLHSYMKQYFPSDSRPASCQRRARNRVQCKSFTWQTGR